MTISLLHRNLAMEMITTELDNFLNEKMNTKSPEITSLAKIHDQFKFQISPRDKNDWNIEADLSEQARKGSPVILNVGLRGHAIGLAVYGKHLIFCNRGAYQDSKGSILVYPINNIENLTEDTIRLLSNAWTIDLMKQTLNKFADMEHPSMSFKMSTQPAGVCRTANVRPLIKTLMMVMDTTQKKENPEALYQDLINFSFKKEVIELIKEFEKVSYPEERDFYFDLFKEILRSLSHNTETNRDQTALAQLIVNNMPPDFIEKFRKEIPSVIPPIAAPPPAALPVDSTLAPSSPPAATFGDKGLEKHEGGHWVLGGIIKMDRFNSHRINERKVKNLTEEEKKDQNAFVKSANNEEISKSIDTLVKYAKENTEEVQMLARQLNNLHTELLDQKISVNEYLNTSSQCISTFNKMKPNINDECKNILETLEHKLEPLAKQNPSHRLRG
jgi:hypothetical protein